MSERMLFYCGESHCAHSCSYSRHTLSVSEFHKTFGAPIRDTSAPTLDVPEIEMRAKLITEEYLEFMEALQARDIVEVADALGDLLYVVHGAALTFGIDLDAVVRCIHESNMKKLGPDGKPILREDGKFIKPDGWQKPDLRAVLFQQERQR